MNPPSHFPVSEGDSYFYYIMAKDSYWFRHDSSAGRGTRMRKLAFIYGHWGKGVYWDVIEMLRDQANYKYPSDEFDLKMLADLIGCKDDTKFINWFNDCVKYELFVIEKGMFYSEVLCNNMKRWESSKTNGSKGGRPDEEKPKLKPKLNLNDNPTDNPTETIIEEKSIEEKKKKNNIGDRKLKFASSLEPFLSMYGRPMLKEFYDYWTEPNKSQTKFRQELEKTWSLERRLETWAKKDKNIKPSGEQQTAIFTPKTETYSR